MKNPPKGPLKGLSIAVTGDFGHEKSRDQLKKWVEGNGGEWCSTIRKETTHLLCTKEHWKKKAPLVKAAHVRGNVKIVTYDWLEDSLMARHKKRETAYLLQTLDKEKEKKKRLKLKLEKQDAAKFERGCAAAKEDLKSGTSKKPTVKRDTSRSWFSGSLDALAEIRARRKATEEAKRTAVSALPTPPPSSSPPEQAQSPSSLLTLPAKQTQPQSLKSAKNVRANTAHGAASSPSGSGAIDLKDLYHIYADHEGFHYDILLFKLQIDKNANSRCCLRLYESHHTPQLYCTFLRVTEAGCAPVQELVAPFGSDFETAFRAFRKVFQEKTLLEWEERCSIIKEELIKWRLAQGNTEEGFVPFNYKPPTYGSKGTMPQGELEKHPFGR